MKKIFIPIAALSLLIAGCANRLLREADLHYSNFEYSLAATQYENYVKSDSSTAVMLKLADCYRNMNRHEEAVKWYALSIRSEKASATDKLHFAQELRSTGNPESAKSWYDEYLLTNPSDSSAIYQRASCDMVAVSDPFYDVAVTEIKTSSSCFSPMLFNGKLYYSAEAPKKPGQQVNYWTGNGYLDIFSASSDNLSDPTRLDSTINSDLHESNIVFSADGNKAFFTRSAMKEVQMRRKTKYEVSSTPDRINVLQICSADLVDGKWTNVQILPFNNENYSCGHPALSLNGNRLFFTSDMPGGTGATDIYYSDFVNGTWSAPVNAGSDINTSGNEMFPVIANTNGREELFFSSDGWVGYGGLDLYRSAMLDGLPRRAQHLPAPFNSAGDDFGIAIASDMTYGYFSSNRNNAEGEDRIFKFTRKTPKFFLDLTVVDKESQVPIPNTEVEITNMKTMTDWKLITDSTGHVLFPSDSNTTYAFKLMCNTYFCGFNNASIGGYRGSFMDTTHASVNLEPIVINKPIRLENIYYDYNKWNIRPDAAIELDKLVKIMQDNPKIRIELSSHTDSRGSDKYNMNLSQKRAQSAVDYIVSKGIDKGRIYAKGYGESKPLNKCTNGVKCTEEEYQWNRRTEFKVVEITQ